MRESNNHPHHPNSWSENFSNQNLDKHRRILRIRQHQSTSNHPDHDAANQVAEADSDTGPEVAVASEEGRVGYWGGTVETGWNGQG